MSNQPFRHDGAGGDTFGSRLRAFRQSRLWTQEMLAERSMVPVKTISALESGVRIRPHLSTVTMLSDALGLSDAEQETLISKVRQTKSIDSEIDSLNREIGKRHQVSR